MNMVYVVGLYLRLSEKDKKKVEENVKMGLKDESLSITNQRSLLQQYINKNNYTLGDIYIDDGYSGSNFNRPEFKRMIEDIENGKINMVITKDMSRLGRDYIEVGNLMEKYFPSKNVRYIAIDDDVDTFLDNNNEITPFKSLINDLYARDISKKAKSSCKARQRSGKYISGRAMLGYDIDKKNKYHLVINKKQAEVVKNIFNMCVQGYSLYKIAKTLTENKVPTPAQVKHFSCANYNYKFGIWHSSSVKDILTNEVYIGHMVQNKRTTINHKLKKIKKVDKSSWIRVENTHEPIIDEETFYKVQKILPKNGVRFDRKEDHLFDGLLYCYECGHRLSIQSRRKSDNNCYTICNHYRSTSYKLCTTHTNNYDKLEKILLDEIKKQCKNYINNEYIKKSVIKKIDAKDKKYNSKMKIKKLEDEISSLNENIDQIYFDKLDGKIDDEMYDRVRMKILNKIKYNKDEIYNLKNEESEKLSSIEKTKRINKIIDEFLKDAYNSREILLNLIDKISIHQDKTIDIKFAFSELN